MSTIPSPRRSLLFTPANQPALVPKALGSGADMVCVDLEDAVAPGQKDAARQTAIEFLKMAGSGLPERVVRINRPDCEDGRQDITALRDSRPGQGILLIPKVNDVRELHRFENLLNEAGLTLRLALLIETVSGVENCFDILKATSRLDFVMFGGADLAAELGTRVAPEPLAYGRSRLVYAARHAQLDVLDMPCLSFRDLDGVRHEAEHARLLGFTGKAVIHPSNLEPVHAAFTPSSQEIEEARRVIDIFRNNTTGVTSLDGKLVEKPVVRTMELVMARARAMGLSD